MDIFKGIGDFFGGLFGQKKKREDEQQPQQQQSAVSFNSAPKLGDNFVNNLSNPTQPQQPKEFAKSSVDLNPVKPVQPVQPQPQMNRDQERQQLANKYRQEETDRYNQGSDHAANFLNDIFSGGKTSQMRENTINQNIQNRVNAEMLRKYGSDDQQVKQNIAQTSQNINKNATAVSDFTKNYNNNLQQTVSAPVSAVKGAANSVVETVPKVSGAITELGANTIKLFDEDNQFANNLIKRVRADREKNIVRKTLNDATGLTDQDNKMAYGLGSSGARMAIDASMTPVTGGLAPAVIHGVEAHSEMMDHLDNIEARKKAEAAAKGEVYTPSSFTSRYLASTANAGAQAAIEKLGIDNLTGKIGGKFAKNMVGRAITGALGEAGEEGAQQYAENFTKKLFDNKQDIHEGVAESALMGGIMGGAGKMAFGGMDSVKNPYKNNDMADGEVSISKLHPDQMGYNKDAVLGKFTGDTRKRMSERSFNMLQDLRANNPYVTGDGSEISLTNKGNTKLTRTGQNISDDLFIAKMRTTPRINQIIENSTYSHSADDFKNHNNATGGFDYRNTPIRVSGKRYDLGLDIAKNNSTGINTLYNLNIKEPALGGFLRPPIKASSNTDSIAQNPQNVNDIADIKKSQAMLGAPLVGHKPEGIGISSGLGDVAAPQGVRTNNIAQNAQKVNDFNREYEPEIQDLQNVYRKYGDDFEFNLAPRQQAVYEHLLRESPRDSEGRYIDPVTGKVTIDQIVDDSVKYRLPNDNSSLPEVNYTETEGTPIYRGQAQAGRGIIKNQTNFADSGNYENGAFFTDNLDTAHKYGDNILETRRNDKNTVSVRESDELQAMASERMDEIMRNPKLYDEMDEDEYDLLEQMALGRPEAFAQYTKKPFVETGDKFGESGEVVYFKGVDDAAGIIRFKQKVEAENLARVAKENLQARHQELTGDQSIAFNEWANELERRAQGFFDEKTGKITINDGDLNTLNHELGHKLLTRADNRAELLADIRNIVGDEALNAKYGENYAEQVANMNPEERANLFAEEYLADGFSDYYNGILAGEDSQRLGVKLGIPPKVLATYDRIVEAIKGILGLQQDTLKQFYAQAETGKFAQDYKQNAPVYRENPVYKVAQDSKGDLAETDQKTRKFAETVLDTDTPPKDFVKLMHAGDESLKYTPKKNSELWNKATKSVQESPERVFNELENTRVANDETMAKGIALAKHYQAMGDDLKASELYVELAKKATEAGRTVQALNLMRRTTPEGVLMSTMREVENYNDKMKDKPNKQINITPEQRAEFLGKLREAYAMPEGDLKEIRARRIAIGEAIREVRDQIPSSKWDKFTTLWKAGLLTAPTTHIRNIAGNVINGGSEKVAQTVGSAFDWMISKGTGKRTLTRNGFSGMLKGIKEGSGYAKDIMRTGIDTTGEIDSKWRDQRTNYGNSLGGKLAQGYTDFVFNSLNASDKIFRGSAEKMSIANQAKAIAINEKLRGEERKARIEQLINNPTNAMLENAKHDADMATFQQDTGLGQFVAKGRQAGGITKKATDIIMPFTGVPSAVADQLVNYSPLGVAKGVKQVADLRKAVKNGLDDSTITALQRKASTQLGRGITGTALLGAGLALANAGLLSGQPRDDEEKRQWAAEGKKANALKIGDTWIPIDTLSPQMILAAAGANTESRIKNGQGVMEAGLNTFGDGVKSWTEQGYMTGIKDAIDTATGDKDLNKYAIQQATSLIPNGIRKTAAAMDDKARQVNYGDLSESMQNSIPLWRNSLPAKYDIYGREIKTNPFSTMLDPQKSSTENPTDLSRKINEFRKNNPELDSVIPKTAPNKITMNGQTRELTSSERSEYQRLLGENISKYMMSGGFDDSSFNKLSEGDKKDMLEKIQSDVKKSVEMALFNKTSKQTNDNAKKIAQNIVNGGGNDLKPEWKTKEQSKDELYKRPELEYERLKEEYDKKKKNGDFDGRKVQELQERMKLRKAEVGKDTPKSYRDMYGSGKQSFNMLLKEMDNDQERNEAMTKVLEYGDKLVAAGLEKKNKFRDKYGNVSFDDSSSGKGGGRKKGKAAKASASSVGTADITSTLSKNLLKTRGSQAKALSAMPTISVRNSGLQAKAKRSAVRFKK